MSYLVSPDVFIEKKDKRYLVFSPLLAKISIVNLDLLLLLKQKKDNLQELKKDERKKLLDAGLIYQSERISQNKPSLFFAPTALILFPTTNCNLRCKYCYADAGEKEIENLDLKIAISAIDYVIDNCLKQKKKRFSLLFHGGGEPTYRWKFLIDCVKYTKAACKRNKLNSYITLATNGILSDKKIDWVIKNIDHTLLSWDGPEDIQNTNRPLIDGSGSFKFVYHTASRFINIDYKFGVRATITNKSVNRLEEIFDFFTNLGIKSLHLEPLFECGRCTHSGQKMPNSEIYIKNYIPLIKKARKIHVHLHNTFAPISTIKSSFCGAAGTNFCVTPEGYISSCLEVSLLSDPKSKVFFYGKYNSSTKCFDINESKRQYLFKRNISNMIGCKDCFAKWQCGGDCLAKSLSFGDIYKKNPEKNPRCLMHKAMLISEIKSSTRGE